MTDQMAGEGRNAPLILVIDDDGVHRSMTCAALDRLGFATVDSSNGADGLRMVKELSPKLVILDVVMPDTDGFSVCTSLRADPLTTHIPVLMVTGLHDIESIDHAFDCGATDFLTKPVNFGLLPYHVKYMLRASETEENLRLVLHKTREASLAKSQFLANMSHELRTPLNAIMGFSEIMYTQAIGPLGEERTQEYAKDIHGSAEHLLQVINDILDVSKVETGKIVLAPVRFDLRETIQKVVRLIGVRASDAGLTIEIQMDDAFPDLMADETRLCQVLINLLSNATKFTPKGGRISITATASEAGSILLAVEDTGVGIAGDQIERALRAFEQIDSGLNRKYEGTGLGLPLARALTELMGGRFSLHSGIGEGTRVTLEFPHENIVADPLDDVPSDAEDNSRKVLSA
ncbi:MAG: ATP-binding protein [Pseudomonadota bacterium]